VLLEEERSKRDIASAEVALTVQPVDCGIRLSKRPVFLWGMMTQRCVESV